MPVEEHKELRELVSHALQAKGVLQKVQAEIRASVFLALEEQDVFKDKNPFINTPLKNYLATTEGLLAVSLIKEFLDFFNLEFTSMVFDPETHAGIDYTFESRHKISKELKIEANDNKVPLLGLVLKVLTSLKNSDVNSPQNSTVKNDVLKGDSDLDTYVSNGIKGSLLEKKESEEDKFGNNGEKNKNWIESETRYGSKKEAPLKSSLSSLGDLPPLMKAATHSSSSEPVHSLQATKELKAALEIEEGSTYDEYLLSSTNVRNTNDMKNETNVSEESEIEEDISEVASGPTDDNTIDLSISKESGKADYLEDIHNRHLLD